MNKENTIEGIMKWAEEISGNWNGDESGRMEDMASQAEDILEACKNLIELIDEMDEL